MPRIRFTDHLQNYQFHLVDISPSLTVPPFVFMNPLAGFSSISAPELTIETDEMNEGNHFFKRHIITGGSVNSITLQRGASMQDADFWRWIVATLKGDETSLFPNTLGGQRRNMLLIQYSGYSTLGLTGTADELKAIEAIAKGFLPNTSSVTRIPGRAWMLFECFPTRYKVASDFDATSSDVSIMELDLAIDYIEEIGLAA